MINSLHIYQLIDKILDRMNFKDAKYNLTNKRARE